MKLTKSKLRQIIREELLNESKVKVGDVLKTDVKRGQLIYGKSGKVVKVMSGMVNVDFGNGDVYGIMLNRIKNGIIVK